MNILARMLIDLLQPGCKGFARYSIGHQLPRTASRIVYLTVGRHSMASKEGQQGDQSSHVGRLEISAPVFVPTTTTDA